MDTNVPIVANGRSVPGGDGNIPSPACRLAAVERLDRVLKREQVLLDSAGEIEEEFRRYLYPSGQPGVGDRFYQAVLQSHPDAVRRVDLPKWADGSYVDFPAVGVLAQFDPADRKFAALARREKAPVLNATDTDWVQHLASLRAEGIRVELICGCNSAQWFAQ
ncbi:MAG: hypothetical protein SNJ79_07065 [Sphingomonadaceae bacterium]